MCPKEIGFFGKRWNYYPQEPRKDVTFLHHRYFTKTIGVEEMKEAFRKYKNTIPEKSLYEGYGLPHHDRTLLPCNGQ